MLPIDFHFAGTLVLYRIPIDRHAPNNFDIVFEDLFIFVHYLEKRFFIRHFCEDASYRPNIHRTGIFISTKKDFWSAIPQCNNLKRY